MAYSARTRLHVLEAAAAICREIIIRNETICIIVPCAWVPKFTCPHSILSLDPSKYFIVPVYPAQHQREPPTPNCIITPDKAEFQGVAPASLRRSSALVALERDGQDSCSFLAQPCVSTFSNSKR
jgi:hypothetical protein